MRGSRASLSKPRRLLCSMHTWCTAIMMMRSDHPRCGFFDLEDLLRIGKIAERSAERSSERSDFESERSAERSDEQNPELGAHESEWSFQKQVANASVYI